MATALSEAPAAPAAVPAVVAGLTLTVGASLLAGAIHAAVVPEHMMEYAGGNVPGWLPLAFAVFAVLGIAWAVAAGNGLTRGLLLAGLALNLVMLGAGILSRTVGLPGGGVEATSAAWTVAVAAEALGAAGCLWLLSARATVAPPRLRGSTVAVLGVLALAAGLFLVGASDVLDHGRMLAGHKWWLPDYRALAGWWVPKGWMW